MTNSPIYAEVLRAIREAEKAKQRTNEYTVHYRECSTILGDPCTCDQIRGES